MTARLVADGDDGRAMAISVLRAGGIVALPTDTVYGIAVDLSIPGGIDRLFETKDRPADRAIMLLLADAAQAPEIGVLDEAATTLAEAGWPGGMTLVVRQRPDVDLPSELTGGRPTIGLRVPDHPCPRALAVGVGPLPTTSANRSGLPTPDDPALIQADLGDRIDLVLDGGHATGGPASTVVDCSDGTPRILRAGAVPVESLAAILDAAGLDHRLRI
jgi:L-threonylcarbamoyladenylate synthase